MTTKSSFQEFRAARAARSPKPSRELTATQATGQARRIVDRLIPAGGPDVNVTSRLSYDLGDDTPTVVTVVTFPVGHSAALKDALGQLPGLRRIDGVASGWIEITRER